MLHTLQEKFKKFVFLASPKTRVVTGGLEEGGDAAKNKRKQCLGSNRDGCSGSGSEALRQQCSGLTGSGGPSG